MNVFALKKGFYMSPRFAFYGKHIVSFCLLLVVCPQTAQAVALTDKSNKHNMSSDATHNRPHALPPGDPTAPDGTVGTDQICIFCHTPHSAAPESILWDRPEPDLSRAETFALYAQDLAIKGTIPGKLDPTAPSRSKYINTDKSAYPNGASRMCLSCHDGVTAIGILRDGTAIAMVSGMEYVQNYIDGAVQHNPIINLSTSHPISFVYNSGVLGDITTARGGGYKLPNTGYTPLDGQFRMQCTTCHDPHDDNRAAVGYPFWRRTGASAYTDVCNSCHTLPTTGAPPLHSLP